jgi:methylglutaconyl-CoA hydratase
MTAVDTEARLVRSDASAVPGVRVITLDSPANRNALSARLRRELADQLDTAIADDAVRVIVLSHTGPVFCSGMDLTEARGAGEDQQGVTGFPEILTTIWRSPKPVLARLAGPARAGGIGIVAACDLAVAVDTATFAFPEVRIGVVPAVISVPVLRRVQRRAAHELFLTGEVFDAHRARRIGLLTSAVSEGQLDAEVTRLADLLRRGAPSALAGAKQLLDRAPGTLDEDFEEMSAVSARFFASQDGQEGIRAVMDKRAPSWVAPEPEGG